MTKVFQLLLTEQVAGSFHDYLADVISRAISAHLKGVEDRMDARIDGRFRSLSRPAEPLPVAEHGERLVSTTEAGKMLGVHKTTILRYEEKGMLPKRISLPTGRTGFKLSELRAFIDALPEASGEIVVSNPAKVKRGGRS